MRILSLDLGERSYKIYIEKGLISKVGQYVNDAGKVAVITDGNVDFHYGGIFEKSIKNNFKKLVLPPGEGTKSFDSLKQVYNFLLDYKISRNDLIIALGGGVIGDLTGFAAATVLRGVNYIQVPTTLLAQVDSSVGGKVAINSEYGKNLIGAFYQPKLVLIDPNCLKTLEGRAFFDGMAEVIKYACIKDYNLFLTLENENIENVLEEIIERCCDIKKQIVQTDEFDTGNRMLLNFGHTIGHAVEKYYNYEKYTHGEAVAIGMYNICLMGERLGITPPGIADRIKNILGKYNLPYLLNIDTKGLEEIIQLDKKTENKEINMIFLNEIGNGIIKKMQIKELFGGEML